MRLLSRIVFVAVLLAPLAVQAQADALADLRLASAVRLALATDARTRGLDVDVTASAGTVTLGGALGAADRRTAQDVARAVRGVSGLAGEDMPLAPATGAAPAASVSEPYGRAPTPARPALREQGSVAYHTVARGETLFSLARAYGTTVEAVLQLNGLPSPELQVGQRLRMR